MTQRIIVFFMIAFLMWPAASVIAQEAPAPHKQPRFPVSRQFLPAAHQSAPVSRDVVGQALILDGEKLRIGSIEMRLFGVVPPQLSANFGPQARSALDSIAAGNAVHCQIRDRDHDGNFLATCYNASNLDMGLELLKRGFAVAARGSLADTELATPYITAEQYAQTQKLGLWSVGVTPPAQIASTPSVPVVAVPDAAKTAPLAAKTETMPAVSSLAASAVALDAKKDRADKTFIAAAPVVNEASATKTDDLNFFARYQLLLTGFVMLATVLSILAVMFVQRRIERREEMRALAAALRGELMAARALCQGRLKAIMTEADDRNMGWPRIRSTLYQAYVGRIGWLGAELARQIASLYGQSNDYAAYYHPTEASRAGDMPKRHALQTMMQHIEEVLPKLALIEETGKRLPVRQTAVSLPSSRPTHPPIELDSTPLPVASLAAPVTPSASVPSAVATTESSAFEAQKDTQKTETQAANSAQTQKPASTSILAKPEASSIPKAPAPETGAVKDKSREIVKEAIANLTQSTTSLSASSASSSAAQANVAQRTSADAKSILGTSTKSSAAGIKPPAPKTESFSKISEPKAEEKRAAPAVKPTETTVPSANSVPLWDAVRKFARDHLPDKSAPVEEALPDYAALIEEDMSSFTFGESDYDFYDESLDDPVIKFHGRG